MLKYGGPKMPGGSWSMLTEALDEIERLRNPWRDLETAPKDGSDMLGYIPGWDAVVVCWFDDGKWWVSARGDGRMWVPTPSHWKVSPSHPEE
jgi:hypothetical protein